MVPGSRVGKVAQCFRARRRPSNSSRSISPREYRSARISRAAFEVFRGSAPVAPPRLPNEHLEQPGHSAEESEDSEAPQEHHPGASATLASHRPPSV